MSSASGLSQGGSSENGVRNENRNSREGSASACPPMVTNFFREDVDNFLAKLFSETSFEFPNRNAKRKQLGSSPHCKNGEKKSRAARGRHCKLRSLRRRERRRLRRTASRWDAMRAAPGVEKGRKKSPRCARPTLQVAQSGDRLDSGDCLWRLSLAAWQGRLPASENRVTNVNGNSHEGSASARPPIVSNFFFERTSTTFCQKFFGDSILNFHF